MSFIITELEGAIVYEPKIFHDDRGYFFESYNAGTFGNANLPMKFVQDNQSFSKKGVIRGLHYQLQPHAQTKLVRVLAGTILDVIVDIRKGSKTYGHHFSIELSSENKKQLLVPQGFAHGFSVLSETAEILYKCDALYNKQAEGGIRYDDPALNIDWQIPNPIVSIQDQELPLFAECRNDFEFLSN